jgi:hypothetical protein
MGLVNVFRPATGCMGTMEAQVGMVYDQGDGTGVIKAIRSDGNVQLSHNNAYEYPYFVYVDFTDASGNFGFTLSGSGAVFGHEEDYETTAH